MSKSLEFIHDSGKIIRFTDCDFVPQEKRDFCESDAFQSSSQTFSSSSSAFQKTQVKDNEIELEDKVDLRTIAQLRYLKKYENKRKRIYLRNLEIVTRKYEEQIEPLIKQRNKLAKEIPTFWPLAIGAFPPLSSHISLSDISPLTHISEVTCHMRPRMSDGFFIRLNVAELVVRDLIPNAFSYYVKSFSENKA
eukprot:MONOS_15497.1-p1 / transcript=MONOS_15497.1 / gene=MONOS_15497 / organism=Monocercomonoides_exilis_PA203 / gene_product=unspecified product / transcript_product=unspecified product / location=Mono_scaffold01251:3297-4318(+) / protein_length=192 / sequence_SO=supercontig / SO=protein_coding / is_pseudo=false